MSRKLVEKRKIDTKTILESYQPSNKVGPILGTFTVKDVITENTISKNNTLYPTETLESLYAFGRGGRFFDENGKLIPAKLMGSLDHPADGNSPEVRLESNAISWRELTKEGNSWHGKVDILNTPAGNILKTHLDYAKEVGGGDFFGVSIRALGDSEERREATGVYERILPDNFEILSIDFVYEPSFGNRATLTESRKARRPLYEALRKLADKDKMNAQVYKDYAKLFEDREYDIIRNDDAYIWDYRDANDYLDEVAAVLEELRQAWAITFEGIDDESIAYAQELINQFNEAEDIDVYPKVYIFSGYQFNQIYNLEGSNAYPDDLNIVAVKDYGDILAEQVGGRWLPDVVGNNLGLGARPNNSVLENKKLKVNKETFKESSLVDTERKKYIQTLKDEINRLQNVLHALDKMEDEEFRNKYPNKNKDSIANSVQKDINALRAELELFTRSRAEAKDMAKKRTEATDLDKVINEYTEEEIEETEAEVAEEEVNEEAEETVAEAEEIAEAEDDVEWTLSAVAGLILTVREEIASLRAELFPVDDDIEFEELDDEETDEEEVAEDEEEVAEDEAGEVAEIEIPVDEPEDLSELTDEELLAYLSKTNL